MLPPSGASLLVPPLPPPPMAGRGCPCTLTQELLRTLLLSHFLWVVCLPLLVLFVCLFSLLDSDLCFPLARLSPAAQPRERDVIRTLRLPREKGRMRFHKLQNVQIALDYLKHRQVKLVNIRNDDIADGNPKLTLGLIWTIILHFQISDIQVTGQSEDMTAKEKLLLWSQRMVEGYQGLRCDNFTSSWRDGRLFNAVIHRHNWWRAGVRHTYWHPAPPLSQGRGGGPEGQLAMPREDQQAASERPASQSRGGLLQAADAPWDPPTQGALGLGACRTRLSVWPLCPKKGALGFFIPGTDVDVPQPDEKSIITYVSSLYDAMPRVPDVPDGIKANELQLRWQEYYGMVSLLLQWIQHHTVTFEERKFPASYEEIEILWHQFLKFKEMELPAKEADKSRSKLIFQSLEAFQAALQTQWSWLLQLCCCIEAHLKENSSYFQEAEEFLRKTQEAMKKKFTCDRSITVTRLEDLLQDSLVR
ncbi:Plectin, partial [Ophiophagus hannah]